MTYPLPPIHNTSSRDNRLRIDSLQLKGRCGEGIKFASGYEHSELTISRLSPPSADICSAYGSKCSKHATYTGIFHLLF